MKPALLAILTISLVGCVHMGHSPEHDIVLVESVPTSCFDTRSDEGRVVSLTNKSSRTIAFELGLPHQSPYSLHAWFFEVKPQDPEERDYSNWHLVLDEYVPPSKAISFDPGDRIELRVYSGSMPTPAYVKKVILVVTDARGNRHESEPVRVCHAPNNSFKPT